MKRALCFSIHYVDIDVPDVLTKNHHQTKYVIIHKYDDKDEDDSTGYYSPPPYSHFNYYSGGPPSSGEKYEYEDENDYHHSSYGYGDGEKDENPHTYGHSYSSGRTYSKKDGEFPKISSKTVFEYPTSQPQKDKKDKKEKTKKIEFNFYNDYNTPSSGFSFGDDFDTPTQSYKAIDSGYNVETKKKTAPIQQKKIKAPKKQGPTVATYKSTYGPYTTHHSSGYNYEKKHKPTPSPYVRVGGPLNGEFNEYNSRRDNTEKYVFADVVPTHSFPATGTSAFGSDYYDGVKDGIEGFASELSQFADKEISKEDRNTLENFRKEDVIDAKEHEAFVADIEEDHKNF